VSNEIATPSLNEAAAALVIGFNPLGVVSNGRGALSVRFAAEARHAIAAFNAARDKAAALLQVPAIPMSR
jgi:hypothetical protein